MKRFGVWLVSAGLWLGCGAVFAQPGTATTTIAPRPRPPQIWISPGEGKLQPIELRDVSIDIRIEGFIATTTMDLTFANPNARVLEGELVFPLASGQTITGYALDVGGSLRQGVVVEKETARVAFEATVRRGIDPGLAELTRGNVFRTRLYPIPANGTRRVAISFDQPLLDAGADYRYVLPLQFEQKIHRFKVHAEAVRAEHKPKVPGAAGGLSFERWRDSFLADLERTDFQPDKELAFAIDKPANPVSVFAVPDALEPAWRTFAAQTDSAAPAQAGKLAAPIRRIALFYDASGSARARDRQRELDFLDLWVRQLRDVDVDLTAFRNDADPVVSFHVHDGDATALRKAIEALPLDGGTSYGAIRLDPGKNIDVAVVLGDGLSDFGDSEPHLAVAGGVSPRVVFLHAAQQADAAALARMARHVGGQVIDLLQVSANDALARMQAPPWMLQSVRVAKGECVDLAPAAPQPAGAATSVFGRCHGAAEIELRFGDGTGASLTRLVSVGDGDVVDPERGGFVQRLWAAARIADLQNAPSPDTAQITDLAKRYSVVTENTSMLVLDRIEDYVHYRVEPREPDLLAQYQTLLGAQVKAGNGNVQQQQHLAQVLKWWTDFKSWHETRHPWLETVLAPAADAEIGRWQALTSIKESAQRVEQAKALAKRAGALKDRWLRDGADDTQRAAWEHEATAVMLELDALRQKRLALAPGSDVVAPPQPAAARYTVDSVRSADASPAVARSIRQASPVSASPAPPPPPVAAASVVNDALEQASVQGSSVREQQRLAGGGPAQAAMVAAKAIGPGTSPASTELKAEIALKEWDPNTPYLKTIRAAHDPYSAYLMEREQQATNPSFFLDCADFFRSEAKEPRLALRVLSNLAEIDIESAPLVRILAYRLEQWERFDLAVPLFETAKKLRGEEPQSYRDLALALTRQPAPDFARATDLLWHVVAQPWDGRFPEIETIALHELNDALARAPQAERATLLAALDAKGADRRLLDPLPVELRVVLTWDADNTDIDLWVIDPTGEVAIYSHPRTTIGGHMSRDFTGGYGPEVFTIRHPIPGTYTVKANYYGSRQQKLAGDVTVQAEFLTDFDTGSSKRSAVTRRLENKQQLIDVGTFFVGAR